MSRARVLLVIAAAIVAASVVGLFGLTRQPTQSARSRAALPAIATAENPPLAPSAVANIADEPTRRGAETIDARSVAGEERDEIVVDVRGSGPTRAAWTAGALALLHALDVTRASDTACYTAGCVSVVELSSLDAYHEAVEAWQSLDAYAAWHGVTRVSAPDVRGDGSVSAAVVVYPPSDAPP